ncbi:MAG TPA: flagellar basal body-associated FliL family protein [Syntrophales bacterium]|jgi:flagellar FliL protein|nr:flagellar basal body-associated FliL family protein [Syntrophales bacterium]HOX93437.1 flagellar basal body-associated FliL family protein [Syntrophales bacterium]HPI56656.1 flagellar basal body-associated FliL family protein [Syntrophales bacterium]HPN24918.1 flagellar basal body-associated FliL family protein [Syntrophales bacterium]HQM29727.1 flagellar basal body-associated FliL family protein [Syntrophales bacterium]
MAQVRDSYAQKDEMAVEETGQKKKSYRKWFFIGLLVTALLAGGVLGGKYLMDQLTAKKAAQKNAKAATVWPMDTFIVNLMDNGGERYLKVVLQLELSDPEAVAELKEIKPKIRDAVLGILSSKSLKDISTTEGKQRLKEEISHRLNGYLSTGKILQVYFTDFVIQ